MASFRLWHLRPPVKLWDVMKLKLKMLWCCDISFCPHRVNFNFTSIPCVPMASFRLWHLRPPTKLWEFMTPKLKISSLQCCIYRFVLIARSILDSTTCAIPLWKALTDGFISSMTPKTSDQVMGTLWPKNWKFHHYNGVAIYRFVLITQLILDVTTCAIPQGKALNDGFISSIDT